MFFSFVLEISLNGDYEDNPDMEPPQNKIDKIEENDSNTQKVYSIIKNLIFNLFENIYIIFIF